MFVHSVNVYSVSDLPGSVLGAGETVGCITDKRPLSLKLHFCSRKVVSKNEYIICPLPGCYREKFKQADGWCNFQWGFRGKLKKYDSSKHLKEGVSQWLSGGRAEDTRLS